MEIMAKPDPTRAKLSVRISKATAERLRVILRDYCGKPLYLKPGDFIDKAISHEIQRVERMLAGDLPMDTPDATPARIARSSKVTLNRHKVGGVPLKCR